MARIALLPLVILPLIVAGCDQSSSPGGGGSGEVASNAASIPCALAGSGELKPDCTVEKTVSADGLVLTLHHPDGGFRRLLVTSDGRGVVAFDGSQAATVTVVDPASIDVAIDGDRYRLPATVKGRSLPAA